MSRKRKNTEHRSWISVVKTYPIIGEEKSDMWEKI